MEANINLSTRRMQLPQYTKGKDFLIFLRVVPLMVVVFNAIIFGKVYFISFYNFLLASLFTFLIITLLWVALTWVAVAVRNWFSKDKDLFKRVGVMVILAIISSTLMLTFIFYGYDHYHFLGYQLNESRYNWAMAIMVIINIFVTFAHEGASNFEKWRDTLVETEQLRKEFMQSQLLGLKSQVNPHFLFNSLNSLSSLISENQPAAEKFLDEMSKVYRYMLRNNDDFLVSVEAELQFIHSYFYLLKARYGEGIDLVVDVSKDHREKFLPPLTLQILLETTISLNKLCKENPLMVEILSAEGETLQIINNEQKKISEEISDHGPGIDNVSNKFRLLSQQGIHIVHTDTHRILKVPLMNEEKISIA